MPAKILNLARLNRKLARLPAETIEAIRPAMAAAADEIVRMAQRFVPVASGKLRDSIGWVFGANIPKGAVAIAKIGGGRRGSKTIKELTITVYAGNDEAFYARWVEFGTVNTPAQPYFFPSYRAVRKSVKAKVRKAVREAAQAEAKRS